MSGYIIYHPKRNREIFDGTTVHYDNNEGNQDPYVWNRQFLHTYCHMTQMTPQEGQINFWVSGDTFPNFSQRAEHRQRHSCQTQGRQFNSAL